MKKIGKIKKQLSGVIFSQNGLRQDQIGRKRDNRILDPNSAHTRPGGANSEKKLQKNSKNQRTTFRQYFQANRGMRQAEKERKEFQTRIPLILDSGEKIPKKNSKKIQKIKKQLSSVIFSLKGMRQGEKERKEFQTRIPLILDPWVKIPKKHCKKVKKLKNNFTALFFAKTG